MSTHNTREIEAWKKLAREKLAPKVTYIDPKFKEVASWAEELLNAFWVEQQKDLDAFIDTLHQELQKAREEERERILLAIARIGKIDFRLSDVLDAINQSDKKCIMKKIEEYNEVMTQEELQALTQPNNK